MRVHGKIEASRDEAAIMVDSDGRQIVSISSSSPIIGGTPVGNTYTVAANPTYTTVTFAATTASFVLRNVGDNDAEYSFNTTDWLLLSAGDSIGDNWVASKVYIRAETNAVATDVQVISSQ